MAASPSFVVLGAAPPASPVVLSVPHAGRDYPPSLRAALRLPLAAAAALEDRHVDAVALAARTDETTLIAGRARAWIDLNRGEDERDPQIDGGAPGGGVPSVKVKSGLGLVPRRTVGGELWRRPFEAEDVAARIAADHRPYHAALADALAAARARWGTAVLLDLHSMPTLPGAKPARIVLGDRFGRAAGSRFVQRLEAEAAAAGLGCRLNAPYAGGHILERHADPAAGVHAVQVELDRALYLDRRMDAPDAARLPAVAGLLRRMLAALADEALAGPAALAAE